jgi:hypothetical protein
MNTPQSLLLGVTILMLPGCVLIGMAQRFRKPNAPLLATLDPRHWARGGVWGSNYYAAPGNKLNKVGWALCTVGLLLFLAKLRWFGMG